MRHHDLIDKIGVQPLTSPYSLTGFSHGLIRDSSGDVPAPERSSSPKYTPAATNHYVYRYRWVALCDRLRGRRVAHLRDMEYEIFEQLEADLKGDPEYSVIHAALGIFFCWVDSMDTLSDEMRLSRPAYLILLEDARSKMVSQSLRNGELISHADRHLVARQLLPMERGLRKEREHGDGHASLVLALQPLQELLDREMIAVGQTFRSTVVVAIHFSNLEGQLEAGLGALEHLLPF
ncbi:hypothetical protein LIER_28232 [Lithospermum erythrorhizon]|uniref:Uncharacterized protein n=1 Tax=Lithospermum erythrorhizon TaxID=34254 RepID=A0AAV3RL02_LITER